jgi:hypothetical protein
MTERKNEGDWSGSNRVRESEAALLERLLFDLKFPATKEDITSLLAVEAYSHGGGRVAELHDIIVNLYKPSFEDIDDLEGSIKERHNWERQHAQV